MRVLVGSDWFDQVSPESMYEAEYQALLVQRAALVFPRYHVVRFDVPVSTEEDTAKADLALVERRYREWWVVEIELAQHSLSGHVLPQVATLSRAYYGEREAKLLCSMCPQLDLEKTRDLLRGKSPRVLVVVNSPCPGWAGPLSRFDGHLCVVQVFRSGSNEYAIGLDGFCPHPERSLLSECHVHPHLLTFLVIDSPGALPGPADGHLQIRHRGALTEWERVVMRDAVWLNYRGASNPLKPHIRYRVLQDESGQLWLQDPSSE